jgi:hypothetical protein
MLLATKHLFAPGEPCQTQENPCIATCFEGASLQKSLHLIRLAQRWAITPSALGICD